MVTKTATAHVIYAAMDPSILGERVAVGAIVIETVATGTGNVTVRRLVLRKGMPGWSSRRARAVWLNLRAEKIKPVLEMDRMQPAELIIDAVGLPGAEVEQALKVMES